MDEAIVVVICHFKSNNQILLPAEFNFRLQSASIVPDSENLL